VSLRRLAFALLLLFAFLTPFIAPAYIAAGLLLAVWTASVVRERRMPESLRSPIGFVLLVLALLTVASAVFSRDPARARGTCRGSRSSCSCRSRWTCATRGPRACGVPVLAASATLLAL
jgi:hypothetical protein